MHAPGVGRLPAVRSRAGRLPHPCPARSMSDTLDQRVGNYPGVTVEMKKGRASLNKVDLELIDLPGTYSLAARSPDEMVAVDLLLGQCPGENRPDVIVAIVDASNLERHLYLTTQ